MVLIVGVVPGRPAATSGTTRRHGRGGHPGVLLVDGAGLLLGGSFWRPTCSGWCPAWCCARRCSSRRRAPAARSCAAIVALSLRLVRAVDWSAAAAHQAGAEPPTRSTPARRSRDVAEPGDTIVVYGGRADIVGRRRPRSPYEHLWSLPMRTLDPDLAELDRAAAQRRPADLGRRAGRRSTPGRPGAPPMSSAVRSTTCARARLPIVASTSATPCSATSRRQTAPSPAPSERVADHAKRRRPRDTSAW